MVLRNRRLSNLGASRFKNYYLKMKQIKLLTGKVRCNSFFFSKIRYIYIYHTKYCWLTERFPTKCMMCKGPMRIELSTTLVPVMEGLIAHSIVSP
jgi:hypothetical protein